MTQSIIPRKEGGFNYPKKPKKTQKPRQFSDYAGKIGPSITTHERLQELKRDKKSVFVLGRPLPAAVVVNWSYVMVCNTMKNGALKEYDPKGGFGK